MKRLISWLLVLAMAIACLPMSAFAVEVENGDGDPDFDVGFEELLHGYSANDPIDLTADLRPDFTATVTVPAGKTMYFTAGNVGGMEMTINGENKGVCVAAPRQPYAWSITNDGAEDAEYVITVAFPVGHQMNPEVIEELAYSSFDVEQAAGDIDGYFYTYTAPAAGTVTLYISNVPEVEVQAPEYDEDGGEITPAVTEKFVGDITVLNENTYANYVLSQDGVDNYGLELQIPVAAGDVLNINTALVADNEDNYYPAGTYSWTGNFTYPAGTEQNPIAIEWTWNEEYTTATASVTVPEGATQYFTGKAGMILTANGEEIAMDAEGTFALPAGTYELKMATPVGAQANPEVIENIDGYTDSNSLKADGAYYYIWTATEDGTVTLDVTDGANITVDKVIEISEDGWPVTEQFQLAEPTVDENWNYNGWTVAENLQIEVVAGQQLKIQVNGLTDWATWTVPAIDYTLTGSFEAAEPEYTPYVVETRGYGLSLEAELIISSKFVLPAELAADENATLKIQFIDDVTEVNLVEYLADPAHKDSKGRMIIEQSVKSFWMTHVVTVTITDGNGYAVNYVDYFGDSHEGSYQFGAENYVRTMDLAGETTINAVRALLTYGAYAQDYFAAQGKANITDERATAILTKYGYEPVDISGITEADFAQEKTGTGDSFDGISIRGNQPTLDAAIYMKVQFNATGMTEADLGNYTYKLSYMVGTTKIEEEIVPEWDSRGRLVFYVYDIAAMLFDCMYDITITKNATGESYTGSTSIISYMNDAYASFANDASFQNLLKAMYAYNQAANTHFGK